MGSGNGFQALGVVTLNASQSPRNAKPEHPKRLEWEQLGRPKNASPCRFCGVKLEGRKTSFCSPSCIHEWRIRSDSKYARDQVQKRDKGVCASCGEYDVAWQADHILEVVNGGGACGLDNLQTLCLRCHTSKTTRLLRLLAVKRKGGGAS